MRVVASFVLGLTEVLLSVATAATPALIAYYCVEGEISPLAIVVAGLGATIALCLHHWLGTIRALIAVYAIGFGAYFPLYLSDSSAPRAAGSLFQTSGFILAVCTLFAAGLALKVLVVDRWSAWIGRRADA